jgi:hypothetical protein
VNLIGVSIVYYLVALGVDLALGCCPQRVQALRASVTSCCAPPRKDGAFTGSIKAADANQGSEAASAVQVMQNPLVRREAHAAASAAESDAAGTPPLSEVDMISSLHRVPDEHEWVGIRASYAALAATLHDLEAEVRALNEPPVPRGRGRPISVRAAVATRSTANDGGGGAADFSGSGGDDMMVGDVANPLLAAGLDVARGYHRDGARSPVGAAAAAPPRLDPPR